MADTDKPDPFANVPPEDLELIRAQIDANLEGALDDPTLLIGLKSVGMEQAFIDDAIDLGGQMLRQGLLDQAFTYCVGLVQFEPLDFRIYRTMAVIQQRKKRYELALAFYHAAIGLNAKDGLSHMYAGECLVLLGRQEEGTAAIRTGVALMKKDPAYLPYVKRGENVLAIQAKK